MLMAVAPGEHFHAKQPFIGLNHKASFHEGKVIKQ